jgi:DNA-directed RNA polymerase subunit omega
MAGVPVDELLKRCGSRYRLVLLAVKRAKEIADGALPLVEMDHTKATSIALEEIRQGKVSYKVAESEALKAEPAVKERGTKPKEKKGAKT